jgi:hypothetical protein
MVRSQPYRRPRVRVGLTRLHLLVVVVVARPLSLRCNQTRCQPSSFYPVALDSHQSPRTPIWLGKDVDAVTLIEHPWIQTLSVLLQPLDFVSYDGA